MEKVTDKLESVNTEVFSLTAHLHNLLLKRKQKSLLFDINWHPWKPCPLPLILIIFWLNFPTREDVLLFRYAFEQDDARYKCTNACCFSGQRPSQWHVGPQFPWAFRQKDSRLTTGRASTEAVGLAETLVVRPLILTREQNLDSYTAFQSSAGTSMHPMDTIGHFLYKKKKNVQKTIACLHISVIIRIRIL